MANSIVTGNFVMVTGLTSRSDLNHRAARVLSKSWTEAAQHPGRVPVEMVIGKEQIWVKLENIEGPVPDIAAMTAPPYDAMTPEEYVRRLELLGEHAGPLLRVRGPHVPRSRSHVDGAGNDTAPSGEGEEQGQGIPGVMSALVGILRAGGVAISGALGARASLTSCSAM